MTEFTVGISVLQQVGLFVLVSSGVAGSWNGAGYHAECCSNSAKRGKTSLLWAANI